MTRYRIGHLQVVIEPFGQTYNYVTETGVLPNLANGPAGSKVISFDFCIFLMSANIWILLITLPQIAQVFIYRNYDDNTVFDRETSLHNLIAEKFPNLPVPFSSFLEKYLHLSDLIQLTLPEPTHSS